MSYMVKSCITYFPASIFCDMKYAGMYRIVQSHSVVMMASGVGLFPRIPNMSSFLRNSIKNICISYYGPTKNYILILTEFQKKGEKTKY